MNAAAPASGAVADISIDLPAWSGPVVSLLVVASLASTFSADAVMLALVPWGVVLGVVSAIDLRELRVPNKIIGPAVLAAVPLLVAAGVFSEHDVSIGRAATGAAASLGLFGIAHLASPTSLGMGDVKLAPYIGGHLALFSWEQWYRGLLYGFICVSIGGIIAMIVARTGRGAALPFAPFLTLGAVIALTA